MLVTTREEKNSNMPEVWKAYPKNPIYEISDEGRVRRKYLNTIHYINVLYYKDGRTANVAIGKGNKKVSFARAVWETFKGEIPKGYIVQYKNGCRSMCDIYNLYLAKCNDCKSEWTADYNRKSLDKARTDRKKVVDNKTGIIYNSMMSCARSLYADYTTIRNICNGKTKKSKLDIDVSFYKEADKKGAKK